MAYRGDTCGPSTAKFSQVWITEAALDSSFDPLFTGRFLANDRPGHRLI
jgi:hypothetical protein